MQDKQDSSNLAVLWGPIKGDLIRRVLPNGQAVVQFDVSTDVVVDGRVVKMSVPVAWVDAPPKSLEPLVAGLEVVVVGTVRRRFFRIAGATQSRTEVAVDSVVPKRRAKQVKELLARAAERLSS